MKVLLDLNIWLDMAARRSEFPDSTQCYLALEQAGSSLYFASCGFTTLVYLLERGVGADAARGFVDQLFKQHIEFIDFGRSQIEMARSMAVSDFEDACQVASAIAVGCDLIISRDEKGFRGSNIRTLSPKKFLRGLR